MRKISTLHSDLTIKAGDRGNRCFASEPPNTPAIDTEVAIAARGGFLHHPMLSHE